MSSREHPLRIRRYSGGFQPPNVGQKPTLATWCGGWKPLRIDSSSPLLPGWLRAALVVTATVILCSCRTQQTASTDPFQNRENDRAYAMQDASALESGDANPASIVRESIAPAASPAPPIALASAEEDISGAGPHIVPGEEPLPQIETLPGQAPLQEAIEFAPNAGDCSCHACMFPEYKLPPIGEVLCDGGDDGLRAVVVRNGDVAGLEIEDTVAHYKTQDGQTVILPTNEVCIYAPRFASVRQVKGASVNITRRGPEGLATDLALVGTESNVEARSALQREQPLAGVIDRSSSLLRRRQQGGGLENDQGISRASSSESAWTSLHALRFVLIDNREQPLVLGGIINAIQWTHDLGVQVVIERRKAQVVASDRQAALVYHVEESPEPRLQVVKLADRASAHPGDVVRFALQYQNVGNRPISELTIVDNLTTRLEYIEGSQVSDRPADFSSEMNDGGSLILRWSLPQPLEPGQAGLIHFDCRVR